MVKVLIFAGGKGHRMNTKSKPKQFLDLHGKPIIIYTLEHFESHDQIDEIVVVCLKDWIRELRRQLHLHYITKVSAIIPGGVTGYDSILYGLRHMKNNTADDDIVLIHDGVRPLINYELISANIESVKKYGNGITAEPLRESVIRSIDGKTVHEEPDRNQMYSAKAPQSFYFKDIYELYERTNRDRWKSIDSSHICAHYGVKMYMVRSTKNNMKITEPADYYIYRALHDAMENEQILGIYGEDRMT